jgi:isocitrate/isopropylmalate dehydrogenase
MATLRGSTLRKWRDEAEMNLSRAATYVSDMIGYEVSSEYIRRMETDQKNPEDWDPIVVLARAHIYKRKEKDLPPEFIARVERIRQILAGRMPGPESERLGPAPRRRTRRAS